MKTKSGIVTVAGKPNVGKSTLLNRLIGQKLSITSEKPQATRDKVVGIRTVENTQMIITDTPGLLDPAYPLQSAMRQNAISALKDADVVVYMVDGKEGIPQTLEEITGQNLPRNTTIITAVNKQDAITKSAIEAIKTASPDAIFISALNGEGIQELIEKIEAALPESPFLYPEEDISTQSMRFFAAEFIRETALEQLNEEVPYSLACEIEEYKENRTPVYIRAVLYVERESQKRILIGEKGRKIRDIGSSARIKIENLIGQKVYLDLWVKVLHNWRKDPSALKRLGFNVPQ